MECKFFLLLCKTFPGVSEVMICRAPGRKKGKTVGKKHTPADLAPLLSAFWKKPWSANFCIHFIAQRFSNTTTSVRDAGKCSTILHWAHYHSTQNTVSHSVSEKERNRQSAMPALNTATECKTFKQAEGTKRIKKTESIDF